MNIYFTETDSSEQNFFKAELVDQELRIVDSFADIAPNAEAVSSFDRAMVETVCTFLRREPCNVVSPNKGQEKLSGEDKCCAQVV